MVHQRDSLVGVLDSPFPHHGPLDPDQVTGRDQLIAELVERVTQRRPTVLLGPRRFGKTSVLRRLARDLGDTMSAVWVDLYEIRSWVDLAVRLDDAVARASGPFRQRADKIAVSFELDLGLVKARFTRPQRPEPEATVHVLLDVMVDAAGDHPTLFVFDEFQSISAVDGAAGLLRTKIQHHVQEMGLVFAGSAPSLMRALFESVDQPFYGQADLVEIEPLDRAALADIVEVGFGGGAAPGLAGRIHDFTGGHPHRAMQLADAAWRHGGDWADALDDVRTSTAMGHEVRYSSMPSADQAVMRIVAHGEAIFGRAAELLELSRSSAQAARRRLLGDGRIAERDRRLTIVDPLFADWIRHRFPI